MRMSSSIVHAFGTPPSMTKASTSYSESSVYEFGRHEQIKNIPTQNFSYLIKYRSIKPNESMKIGKAGEKSYIPDVICDIFNLGDRNSQSENIKKKYQVQCSCGKTEDGLCELIMGWIEDEYYWKTDKQFHKIYDYYQNKKLDQGQQLDLKIKLSRIQQVLGIEIGNECTYAEQRRTINCPLDLSKLQEARSILQQTPPSSQSLRHFHLDLHRHMLPHKAIGFEQQAQQNCFFLGVGHCYGQAQSKF